MPHYYINKRNAPPTPSFVTHHVNTWKPFRKHLISRNSLLLRFHVVCGCCPSGCLGNSFPRQLFPFLLKQHLQDMRIDDELAFSRLPREEVLHLQDDPNPPLYACQVRTINREISTAVDFTMHLSCLKKNSSNPTCYFFIDFLHIKIEA